MSGFYEHVTRIWWCEVHNQAGGESHPSPDSDDCRMVERGLVDPSQVVDVGLERRFSRDSDREPYRKQWRMVSTWHLGNPT